MILAAILTVRQVARALRVSETLVYDWIRTKHLPTCGRDGEARVHEAALREWALSTGTRLDPADLAASKTATEPPGPRRALAEAIERGGVMTDVPGECRMDLLREIVARLPLPEGEDRAYITEMILAREALASTGIGRGIAVPHARTPVVVRLDRPMVAVAYPRHPIPFDAPDGVPVHALFTLLSPTSAAHLEMLGHLAHALQGPDLPQRLRERAALPEILAAVRGAEPHP